MALDGAEAGVRGGHCFFFITTSEDEMEVSSNESQTDRERRAEYVLFLLIRQHEACDATRERTSAQGVRINLFPLSIFLRFFLPTNFSIQLMKVTSERPSAPPSHRQRHSHL